ncbi:DinB family protein [Micromonospora sp. NPDC023966]|uniref:DinB family protein n=1 Tax=Micromonospora sp. NPDC023966 TaxID=3154699 RepID=UPI0033C48CFB
MYADNSSSPRATHGGGGRPSGPSWGRRTPTKNAGRRAVAYPGTAEAALRQLDDGHDGWIRDVRHLGAAGLAQPQGAISPPEYADALMARLILHVHREVIHHGAEISLLRDLYLWKGSRGHL